MMSQKILFVYLIFSLTGSAISRANDLSRQPLDSANNAGKILFLKDSIRLDARGGNQYIKRYEISAVNNLYMQLFLAKPLTSYQHLLNQALTTDQLNKGNFNFRFYVDDKVVYNENLNAKAGSNENKNTKTEINQPLFSTYEEDAWGRYLWYRFLINGGDDALTTGDHVLKIEVRSYITMPALVVGDVIAEGQLKVIVPAVTAKEKAIQPVKPDSGWMRSGDKIDKEKIQALNGLIAQYKFKDITSIVVIKNDKILLEEYFNGSGRDSLHDPRSVSKSFTSAVMGIAINDGDLKNEYETLGSFYHLSDFNNYSPQKKDITLKSLLTMSSIFDADDNDADSPGKEDNMYPTSDWVKFALDLKIDSSKLTHPSWHYFTAGLILLGDILNRTVPGGFEKYADQKLFDPLGIKNYQWQYTPQHVPNTAGGLEMKSLDFARFGQLYLNGGSWKGQQLIPAAWVKKTFTKYMVLPPFVGGGFYGYLFWNKTYVVNGKNYETYFCTGNGGNKIYVFPENGLVIVVTATAYNKPYAHVQVDKMMQKYILPAIFGYN